MSTLPAAFRRRAVRGRGESRSFNVRESFTGIGSLWPLAGAVTAELTTDPLSRFQRDLLKPPRAPADQFLMKEPQPKSQHHTSRLSLLLAILALAAVFVTSTLAAPATAADSLDPAFGSTRNIWIDRDVLRSLPTSGGAWDDLARDALGSWGSPLIADQNSKHDTLTLAGALYAVRVNDLGMRNKVVAAIEGAVGTEQGGTTLALARNLTAYVLAADIVGYRTAAFEGWVRSVRQETLSGRTLISTHEDRPNNWGTHAGAARIAADLYIGDTTDLARAATVFRGYLGDRSAYAKFSYGDLEWQSDEARPVGINPRGATKYGFVVDGAIGDDVRRCECPVSATPPKENYQWEAMQGIATQATLLQQSGYPDVWSWSDSAIGRAATFLYQRAQFPAEGDDTFVTYLLDRGLGTSYSGGVDAKNGKSIGYTDWTHAGPAPAASATTTTTAPAPTTTTTTAPSTTPTTTAPSTTPTTTASSTTSNTTTTTASSSDDTDAVVYSITWGRWELRVYSSGLTKLYKKGSYVQTVG